MAPYIGTPTSRVDGHAKVTGAAKYAGEFNVSGLAYGALVTSTIAKGRIARIDVSEVPGKPGVYRAVAFLRPHFQLDELTVSLRLVAELPAAAK